MPVPLLFSAIIGSFPSTPTSAVHSSFLPCVRVVLLPALLPRGDCARQGGRRQPFTLAARRKETEGRTNHHHRPARMTRRAPEAGAAKLFLNSPSPFFPFLN